MPRPRLALLLHLIAPVSLAASDGRDLGAAQPAVVVEGKRVALVIGNGAYEHAGRLAQAPTDAQVMADSLEDLGFTVIERYDQSLSGMARAAADFDAALNGAAVGAFYYAGHAVQVDGRNFLVPVDADLDNPRYVDAEALDMSRLMRTMDDAGSQLNLVVLDACRNNPWEGRWTSVDRALGGTRGLAQVNAPRGFIVAYATGPGDVAADNGVYAAALARGMKVPGREIVDVFRDVFAEVTTATRDDQVPWVSVAMSDRFFPAGTAGGVPVTSEPVEVLGSGTAGSNADIGSLAACAAELARREASLTEQAAADWSQIEPLLSRKDALTRKAVEAWVDKWGPGKAVAEACGEQSVVEMEQAAGAQRWLVAFGDIGDSGVGGRAAGSGVVGKAGIEWVPIPAGSFEMGSYSGDDDEKPVRTVRVSSFELSRSEVTVDQYRACVDAGACLEPDTGGFKDVCNYWKTDREHHPVNCVDWEQAWAFARWAGGRLPSESEWEYAARAGELTSYAGSNLVGDVAWYKNNSASQTHEVCSKRHNGYGLCDMSGNVSEWVEDWYHQGYRGAPSDGSAWSSGGGYVRVLRGGSRSDTAARVRVANRGGADPTDRRAFIGFRVAR